MAYNGGMAAWRINMAKMAYGISTFLTGFSRYRFSAPLNAASRGMDGQQRLACACAAPALLRTTIHRRLLRALLSYHIALARENIASPRSHSAVHQVYMVASWFVFVDMFNITRHSTSPLSALLLPLISLSLTLCHLFLFTSLFHLYGSLTHAACLLPPSHTQAYSYSTNCHIICTSGCTHGYHSLFSSFTHTHICLHMVMVRI